MVQLQVVVFRTKENADGAAPSPGVQGRVGCKYHGIDIVRMARFHGGTCAQRQLVPCTSACGQSRVGATAASATPKPPSTKRPLQEYSRNVSITRLLHRIVVWRWSDASRIQDRQLLFCVCMHV